MHKAVFFSGVGTIYTTTRMRGEEIEIYPETLPALRFLARRGYSLVLVTNERQEYKNFVAQLKDKSLTVLHYSSGEEELLRFAELRELNLKESFFVTDGLSLKSFQTAGCQQILVLSGKGVQTLSAFQNKHLLEFSDVCKGIYAAAFSIALNNNTSIKDM